MRGSDKEKAYNQALKLLRYRARSTDEIRKKLNQAAFSRSSVEAALQKLTSLSLLNDESFARNWASTRIEQRGYGPLRAARELAEKGIPKCLVDQILQEAFSRSNTDITENAKTLLQKRFRSSDLTDPKNLRRAAAFLQRRGYPSSVIMEVLGQDQLQN
jgi:regulatory protein